MQDVLQQPLLQRQHANSVTSLIPSDAYRVPNVSFDVYVLLGSGPLCVCCFLFELLLVWLP
jgi:hypothetical protein